RVGTSTWTPIGEDTAAPWSVTFDTTAVADGPYDLRAVSYDSSDVVLRTAVHQNVVIDNTRPHIVSSTPADGSIVDSATSIAMTASETIVSVESATLDGAPVTPTVSGT